MWSADHAPQLCFGMMDSDGQRTRRHAGAMCVPAYFTGGPRPQTTGAYGNVTESAVNVRTTWPFTRVSPKTATPPVYGSIRLRGSNSTCCCLTTLDAVAHAPAAGRGDGHDAVSDPVTATRPLAAAGATCHPGRNPARTVDNSRGLSSSVTVVV